MFTRCKVSVCQYKSAAHVYRDWAHHQARVSRLVMALTLTVTTPALWSTLRHCSICPVMQCPDLPIITDQKGLGSFL